MNPSALHEATPAPTGTAPAIEVRDLTRHFAATDGRVLRAVDGVSFRLDHGEVLGIVGESGCGKSTLARLILGLEAPSSGQVLAHGQDLRTMERRARARLIQPVFQDPYSSLNPHRHILDIVGLPLDAQGMDRAARDARVLDMLQRVGLSATHATRLPGQLSGGQRQRVAIARALVPQPRIVVCDEPTSALDVSVQAQILNLLTELRRELGLTLVFISHNLAVIEHVATEVMVMYLGRAVEKARGDALFRQPAHPYTRALLASVLTPEPGLGLPDAGLGDGQPDPTRVPAGCRFHPRCPQAVEACRHTVPATTRAGGREVECLLAEPGPQANNNSTTPDVGVANPARPMAGVPHPQPA
jgi:peptide/nickel transport system ATP-binding protein